MCSIWSKIFKRNKVITESGFNDMYVTKILTQAVQFDKDGKLSEAFTLYEEGTRALLDLYHSETNEAKKKHYQTKLKEYIERAEEIKKNLLQKSTAKGDIITMLPILENSTGNSYKSIFGKYLDENVRDVEIDEPYLKEHYQFVNLIVFLELIVKKCKQLKLIQIRTKMTTNTKNDNELMKYLNGIKNDLKKRDIQFLIEISENLHDRQIILSNGYIIKIGRGLHFFKPVNPKYSLGLVDYDFRQCLQTNVDVYKWKI